MNDHKHLAVLKWCNSYHLSCFLTGIYNYDVSLRVTVVKDKNTRQSKGVAFVLFLDRESAHNCARAVNNKQVSLHQAVCWFFFPLSITQRLSASNASVMDVSMWNMFASQLFGRMVKASIAIDNGRAAEFIRRRNYTDKSKCYECGVSIDLSFSF